MWKCVARKSENSKGDGKRERRVFFLLVLLSNKDVESGRRMKRTNEPTKQQCCRVMETGHTTGRAITCQTSNARDKKNKNIKKIK
jgi:hypothetical protein